MIEFFREIYAVALRDIKRRSGFLKYLAGIFLTIAVLYIIGFGFDSFVDFKKYGSSYTEFFIAGITMYSIIGQGLQVGLELITDKNGFIKVLLISPISRLSILFGKILSSFVVSIKSIFVIIVFFVLVFDKFSILRLLEIMLFILFTILTYNGLGLWLSSIFKNREIATNVITYLSVVVLFISGILYPIQAMPALIQKVFYFNPIAYNIDLFRYIMIGENYFPVQLSLMVSLIFGIVSIFLGTYMFDRNHRK